MTNMTPLSKRERELYLLIAQMADDNLSALRDLRREVHNESGAAWPGAWLDKIRATVAKADAIVRGGGA